MYSLTILEEAKKELFEAILYYETQKVGLGMKFYALLEQNIKLIQENPKHYQKTNKQYREALVPPFPFVIIYRIDKSNNIFVVSIFHKKRKPKLNFKRK